MPRRKVTRLRKACGQLAGHSWQQAERIAQAATEAVRHWLPDAQEIVDLLHFQLCLGEKLEAHRDRLTEIDNQHAHELQVDRNLRQDRDEAAADLREIALQLRSSFDGLYGTGGSTKIFEEAPIIPTDPVALIQLMAHVQRNLGDDEFPMPKPLQKGFKLDREAAVKDLQEPFQRLGIALKALEAAESNSKHSQSLKDAEVAEVEAFTGKVYRFYESLYDLVGFDRLSKRVRRSARRSTTSDPETGNPETGDPEIDAPETAANDDSEVVPGAREVSQRHLPAAA